MHGKGSACGGVPKGCSRFTDPQEGIVSHSSITQPVATYQAARYTNAQTHESTARDSAPARVPFSGGAEGALHFSRGAESVEHTLRRLWAALRR